MRANRVIQINHDVRAMVQERAVARELFNRRGESITAWALARGFNPNMVQEVLAGRVRCQRGQAHRIAVALGLKSDVGAAA